MSRLQPILLPFLAAGAFLLTASMEPTAAPVLSIPAGDEPKSITPWSGEPCPMPESFRGVAVDAIMNRAMAQNAAEQIAWLDMEFQQQVAVDDIRFDLQGRYASAPGQRARYELHVKIGADTSDFLTVCDGDTLYEVQRFPGRAEQTNSSALPRITQPTDDPAEIAAARQKILEGKFFPGPGSLLASLSAGLKEPKVRSIRIGGRELLEVRGKWVNEHGSSEILPPEYRLRAQATECRVFLDATTLWPCCIEWWGDEAGHPLVQSIYGQTAINQPLTAAQMAVVFRPQLGDVKTK